jgi:hypothetical protein
MACTEEVEAALQDRVFLLILMKDKHEELGAIAFHVLLYYSCLILSLCTLRGAFGKVSRSLTRRFSL